MKQSTHPIKVRSYNEDLKRCFYFFNGVYYNDDEYKEPISDNVCPEFNWNNTDCFTGIVDKNNKDIYESDVFRDGIQFWRVDKKAKPYDYWFTEIIGGAEDCGLYMFSNTHIEKCATIYDLPDFLLPNQQIK